MTEQEHLIGTAEVARTWGVSTRTVHRMVKAGQLTPALIAPGGIAGSYLFRRADIEAAKKAAS